MGSPIFDSTFGTGRFKHEEPMTTPFTPKEDRMTITDADLDYLRNINTSPGPNAGKSIDPTKPGPDADRASPEPQNVRETPEEIARKLAVIELGVSDETFIGKIAAAIRAALAQSDDALKTRFEEWALTRGHRNFTKSGGGYLLPEIQKDWLAFKAGATALPPDCPTDGVAARQGNGG